MGRVLGYTRESALRYSFLLAVPAVFGSGFYELKTAIGESDPSAPYSLDRNFRRNNCCIRCRVCSYRLADEVHCNEELYAIYYLSNSSRYGHLGIACYRNDQRLGVCDARWNR